MDTSEHVVVSATTQPPAKRRTRRTWGQRILLSMGSVATVMTLLVAGALAYGADKFDAIPSIGISSVETAEPGEASNWLLVGTDSREGIDPDDPNAGIFLGEPVSGKRTDSIIIARIDPARGRIDLLSLPRDLYIPISGTGGTDRINTAFTGDGGPERLVNTIESNFGIEINHYAEVNFVGFQAIVDSLDGVPMWFDRPMRDPSSGLSIETAGCQTLDGFQALAFARSRHLQYFENGAWRDDPTGDLGRTSRQQYFLRRVVDTALSKLDITELSTINNLLDAGGKNLILDAGTEPSDLLRLADAFASLSGDQINGHALPVENFRTNDGKAVLNLLATEAQPTLDLFRGVLPEQAPVTAPAPLELSVLNGSGVAGQAATTAERLVEAGFAITAIGDAGSTGAATTISYEPSYQSAVDALVAALGFTPVLNVDEAATGITLITGTDLADKLASTPPEVVATTLPPAAPTEAPTQSTVGIVPEASPEGTACG